MAASSLNISDIVRMSKKGISQDIILRQMELTNAVFNLTVDDIIELHDAGVNEAIIRAMQERRTAVAYEHPNEFPQFRHLKHVPLRIVM